MTHQIGDRTACDCGRLLVYTSDGWIHAGVNYSACIPHPVAMPIDETRLKPLPAVTGAAAEPDDPKPQSTWLDPQLNLRSNTSPRDAADQLRSFYTAEWIADLLVALLSPTAFTESES